jgi:hypothetical protein
MLGISFKRLFRFAIVAILLFILFGVVAVVTYSVGRAFSATSAPELNVAMLDVG